MTESKDRKGFQKLVEKYKRWNPEITEPKVNKAQWNIISGSFLYWFEL